MNNKKTNLKVLRALAVFLILSMTSAMFGGCGIIIINGGDTETSAPTAETTLPEATAPAPETAPPEDTAPETDTSEETTEEPEETVEVKPVTFPTRIEAAQNRLDALLDTIDISNFDLILVNASDTVDVIFSEQSDPLYAARSNRNSMLYEKYEVDIRTIYSEAVNTDTIYADLAVATKAGNGVDYYVDLLMIPANRAGGFLAKGLLKDMRTLPFYDTRSGNNAGNVGSMRYFDLGDGTDAPELIYSIFFNRTMVGKEMTDKLYGAALEGSLGFETIMLAAESAAGREADIGLTQNDKSFFGRKSAELLGIDFITKDRQGVPKLEVSDENILALESYAAKASAMTYYTPAEGEMSSIEAFIAGKTPFYLGTLADISKLYDKSVEWGVLPLPSDKGLGAIADNRPIICLPALNSRLEQTSLWLSGFNAASGEWIRDQFLAVSIEEHLRDNNSCLVLHKILMQKTELSFSLIYSGYYEGLAEATYLSAGSGDYAAVYKSKLSAINKKLAKLPS